MSNLADMSIGHKRAPISQITCRDNDVSDVPILEEDRFISAHPEYCQSGESKCKSHGRMYNTVRGVGMF